MRSKHFMRGVKRAASMLVGLGIMMMLWDIGGNVRSAARAGGLATLQADTSIRTGYDPLSPEEQSLALSLARNDPAVAALLQGGQRAEVLFVERHDEDKAVTASGTWPRRADVLIYDYRQDALTQAIVNLHAGTTDSVQTVRGVQLPPTAAETTRAVELVLGDGRAGGELRNRYQFLTGAALARADQLQVSGGLFRATSLPERVRGPAAACGVHRCVEVLLATPNGEMLGMQIIDLSSGQLIELSR